MNPDFFATLITLLTLYFLFLLLALWWATVSIRFYIRQAVNLIRQQRNEDLRWHRDCLLAEMRTATRK